MGLFVVREEDGGRLPHGPRLPARGHLLGPRCARADPRGRLASPASIALIGLLSAAWDRRKQGWHDKLARSLVVKQVPL